MNARQMALFPVLRKNFIATDALFPYLPAPVPLFFAYNRLEIAFYMPNTLSMCIAPPKIHKCPKKTAHTLTI